MKQLSFALLLAVLGLARSQERHCCVPNQWEGERTSIYSRTQNEAGLVAREHSLVFYDYSHRRVATLTNVTVTELHEETFQQLMTFVMFREMMSYSYNILTGICVKHRLSDMAMGERCLPGAAQKVKDVEFGAHKGMSSLQATVYNFAIPTMDGKMTGSLAVTEDCLPITETAFLRSDMDDAQMIQSSEYYNIRPDVLHPQMFELPDACQDAPEEVERPNSLGGFLMSA